MCQRLAGTQDAGAVEALWGDGEGWCAAGSRVRVLRPGERLASGRRGPDGGIRTGSPVWGYRPGGVRTTDTFRSANARLETAHVKAWFRTDWRYGRTVVPAACWYERSKAGGWVRFRRRDGRPTAIGALETAPDNLMPGAAACAALVTRASGPLAALHHHRQPVVLACAEDVDAWCGSGSTAAEIQMAALRNRDELFVAEPVNVR